MRKVTIILVALLALLGLAFTAVPAVAGPPTTVTVTWLEDAIRYNPDGTVKASWTNDPLGPMDLLQTGKAYHVVTIDEYYNYPGLGAEGSLVISGARKLSGQATYTSPASGLPIKDRFKGNVTIDGGTMAGAYTQYSYAFGSQVDVLASYSGAVPEKSPEAGGWWFIGYTEYIAHQ